MSQIFDHTYSEWVKNKRMENGAATYSRDIINAHADQLLSIEGDNLISTCPHFDAVLSQHIKPKYRRGYDNAIQYLHVYPYDKPIEWACNFYNKVKVKPKNKILLVTAYYSFFERMCYAFRKRELDSVMDVVNIPMSIDTSILPSAFPKDFSDKRVIWLGNIYKHKEVVFEQIKTAFKKQGWQFDYISESRFNGSSEVLTQSQIWDMVNKYPYGIGVGRCALEMQYMGLKVMIAGQQFGGIIMSVSDSESQKKTNHNGRIITFDRDINACIEALPESLLSTVTDIKNINHAEIISNCL